MEALATAFFGGVLTFFGWIKSSIGPVTDGSAKQLCNAIEAVGFDCGWKATRAVMLCVIAILLVLLTTWIASRSNAIRRALNGLYTSAGVIAAVFLLAMLGIIVMQMVARWSGQAFPGSTAYAGYCMAASSFFALAYALNSGAHIRVNLLLNALGRHRTKGELWCFAIAALLATYFARYAIKYAILSEKLGEKSQGQDATPLWIPQIAMCVGTVLLAISLWDNFFRLIIEGRSNIEAEELEEDAHAVLPMEG